MIGRGPALDEPAPHACRLSDGELRVRCTTNGLFVGVIPLLRRERGADGSDTWLPRGRNALSEALSTVYGGLRIDVTTRCEGIAAVARALNDGDLARARMTARQLAFPEPPTDGAVSREEIIALAARLHRAGLLAND